MGINSLAEAIRKIEDLISFVNGLEERISELEEEVKKLKKK